MTLSHPKTFQGLYGSYELVEVLKSGRMATIWKGRNSQNQALVAIKLYHPVKWESSERLEKKLCREGLATKVLEHPSICKVLDFFHTPDGHNGLVMEYLDGMDLSEFIGHRGHRPFCVKGAIRIIREVARALDYAHHLGDHNPGLAARNYRKVLHQDIKPANIFITQDNEIKLIDFGVSRVESEEKEIQHMGYGFTRTYTAPDLWDENEEFLGDKYSENHDIYSLGLVFYELITGQEAFKSIPQARKGKIKALSASGEFPPEFQAFFEKWTHVEPEKRFQSISELDSELERMGEIFKEDADISISQELEIFRQRPFQTIKSTLMETMRSTATEKGSAPEQNEFMDLLLRVHLQSSMGSGNENPSLLQDIVKLGEKYGVSVRPSGKLDDFTLKSVYDIFKSIYPAGSNIDWSEFKEIITHRERFLEVTQNLLSKKERYAFYHKALAELQGQDTDPSELSSTLFDFRSHLDLDPFQCDRLREGEKLTLALSGVALMKTLKKGYSASEIHKYLQSNFTFPTTKTSQLIKSLQSYKPSKLLVSSPEVEPVVKHAIYALLGKLAGADNDISVAERAILERVKISLGDKNLSFGEFKGKSIPEIITSVPEGKRAFVISRVLFLVLSKLRLTETEKSVFWVISEQIKKTKSFEKITESQLIFLLESLMVNAPRLGSHSLVLKEIKSWLRVSYETASESSAKFNLLRQLFEESQLPTKQLADVTECLYGKKRQHNPGVPMLFLAEYYLYLHLKVCHKNPEYETLASNMMSSFKHPESFDQHQFAYDLLKHYLKYHVEDGFFSSHLDLHESSEREIRRILADLKIHAEVLQDAIRKIKLHYNVTIRLGAIRKSIAA